MMKCSILGLAAALFLWGGAAHAQDTVADRVFSAVEKRIVRDYFGVPAPSVNEDDSAPEWAVKDRNGREDDGRGDSDQKDGDKKDKAKTEKGQKDKGLPPGLAKRDQLPPGLAKQLKEKGRLPPGIAKRNLPADLSAQLPVRPEDQDVQVVDNDVVLIDKATGIILDVIKDVVGGSVGGAVGGATQPDGTLAPPSSQGGAQDQGSEDNLLDAVLKGIFGGGN